MRDLFRFDSFSPFQPDALPARKPEEAVESWYRFNKDGLYSA